MRPDGTPASSNSWTKASPVSGVRPEGLSTTPLPPISAGPSLCATRFSGSLNGVMAATIPTGLRLYQPILLPPAMLSSKSRVSPVSSLDAAAESRSVSMQRRTSRSASVMVLLLSAAMIFANRTDCSPRSRSAFSSASRRARSGHVIVLEVAMNVGDRAPHVLRTSRCTPAQQDAVFRIPYLQGHVGGLPMAFEEGTAGKIGDLCPAVGVPPLFWARVSDAC